MATSEHLAVARAAAKSGQWLQAREAYAVAAAVEETADAVHGLGRTCWWLGDVRSAVHHLERAFTLYHQVGRDDEAAMSAIDLCIWYLTNLDNPAVAHGWLARADRCAHGTRNDTVRGWVVLVEAYLTEDHDRQLAGIQHALELAGSSGDEPLRTMAMADLGQTLVAEGHVAEGMALLDEAMAATLGGLDQRLEVVVWSSCNMLAACGLVDDLTRATQWCRAADRFTETYGCPFLQARCRAHFGHVLVASGDWDRAEAELGRALAMAEEVGQGPLVEARGALAQLRARQGRLEDATALLETLDISPATAATAAEVELARGEHIRAASELRAQLILLSPTDPDVVLLTSLLCEAYLAGGDLSSAEQLLSRADRAEARPYPRAAALLTRAKGLVAAAKGESEEALSLLTVALGQLQQRGLPFEAARTRLDLAATLARSDPEAAVVHASQALRRMEQLGASHQAAAAAATLRSLGVTPGPVRRGRGVLTHREREVLTLVSAGLSNPEIAERLFLSRKTVSHHVSRILTKLDLRSRAEAAAYAAREGTGSR